MTTPTLRAIKCSERMPTREDANDQGYILCIRRDGSLVLLEHSILPCYLHVGEREGRYWFPLNRSAIATDAEEQT